MKRLPADIIAADVDFLRSKLKLKSLATQRDFSARFPHAQKFFNREGIDMAKLREYSAKALGASALAGTLVLAPPAGVADLPSPAEIIREMSQNRTRDTNFPQQILVDSLKQVLSGQTESLSSENEDYLEALINQIVGVKVKVNLEGERLNTAYGLIGAEQHLKMYPGDSLTNHSPFKEEGMAPGLGAWGYFASTKDALTPDLEETEKWYAVVQTLYLPDWNRRAKYLREWYKYRKVLIVNTENGNAVVAAIADSGPAAWTGKQFGGSPEVMEYLGGPRYKKGPVLVFFVDDPENKIPLGPVDYNKLSIEKLSLEAF
jgi:hypothetical protein